MMKQIKIYHFKTSDLKSLLIEYTICYLNYAEYTRDDYLVTDPCGVVLDAVYMMYDSVEVCNRSILLKSHNSCLSIDKNS